MGIAQVVSSLMVSLILSVSVQAVADTTGVADSTAGALVENPAAASAAATVAAAPTVAQAGINGSEIHSVNQLNQSLAKQLNLSRQNQKGYDELYKMLTDLPKDSEVYIDHGAQLQQNLGIDKVEVILNIMNDAHEYNEKNAAQGGHHLDIWYWE